MKNKKLITESDVVSLIKEGKNLLYIDSNTLITPAARDKINERKIKIEVNEVPGKQSTPKNISRNSNLQNQVNSNLKIVLASDHTGYAVKESIKKFLPELGQFTISDAGTNSEESCDYPDFAFEAAKKVALHEADFGIIFDATGIPSAITANKVPGIRAATCYNEFSAQSAREHNNANIIVLGAKSLGIETIKSILKIWFSSGFLGDRHQRRLDKISEIEKHFINRKF
jgi:ribose 5-phosphate isomerase B